MNLLLISPHPGFGGASTANQNIARSLKIAGHQVIYMDEYFPKEIGENIDITIDYYPIHQNGIKKQIRTYKYLSSLKPDAILLGMPIVGLINIVILLIFRLRGVKIGCIFHSLSLSNSFKGKTIDFIISCFTIICSHLFMVSKYTLISWQKFWFIKFRKNSTFVIHNVIQNKEQKFHKRDHENIRLGFVGRFSDEKQPVIFCELAKHYHNKNIKFVAFGDGPLFEECNNKYANYVDFHGYCNDMDIIYNSIDILLSTSKFENCPMIILEAARYGIPTIAPNVGGIPEIIQPGENGELYVNYDMNEIRDKIDKIINNYQYYSEKALDFIKLYTAEKKAHEWNNALNK